MHLPTSLLLLLVGARALALPPVAMPLLLERATEAQAGAKPIVIVPVYTPAQLEAYEEAEKKREAAKALRPRTRCTFQVNYLMNTYFLLGDNWNATKDTIKGACEKGRTMNHWSYRDWKDDNGTHFEAKFNLPLQSEEKLEDRLDKVIKTDDWSPEINCEFVKD